MKMWIMKKVKHAGVTRINRFNEHQGCSENRKQETKFEHLYLLVNQDTDWYVCNVYIDYRIIKVQIIFRIILYTTTNQIITDNLYQLHALSINPANFRQDPSNFQGMM